VISFRYHLITIVAIFLALALGVLAGTTVIKSGLVKTLRGNTLRAEQQLRDAQRLLGGLQEYRDTTQGWLIPEKLAGQTVVVVTDDRADPAGARNAVDALRAAGADVISMTVTSLLTSEGQTEELAAILGLSPDNPQPTLVNAAAVELAKRLAQGAPPEVPGTTTASANDDILVSLIESGFVTSPDVNPDDASTVGGPDQLVVVSAGGQSTPGVPIGTFMRPLVLTLVEEGSTTAAVETFATLDHPFVPLIRVDEDLTRDNLITVDDMELVQGRDALVLGLTRLLEGATGGDYGVKAGHDELIPSAP
jgi:hypothetical protein